MILILQMLRWLEYLITNLPILIWNTFEKRVYFLFPKYHNLTSSFKNLEDRKL